MELDAERFETVKELAALGTQIAEAHALLAKLKSESEDYLKEREAETRNRIYEVLVNAQSLIAETTTYHDTFKSFLTTTGEIREKIRDMVTSLSALREETRQFSETFDRMVQQKTEEMAEERRNLRLERESLQKEQEYLNTQKEIISQDKRKVEDERETLKRAFERLKK